MDQRGAGICLMDNDRDEAESMMKSAAVCPAGVLGRRFDRSSCRGAGVGSEEGAGGEAGFGMGTGEAAR